MKKRNLDKPIPIESSDLSEELKEKQKAPSLFSGEMDTAEENLLGIEKRIEHLTQLSSQPTSELCIALARIKKESLYRESGNVSFKEYLASGRIKMSYSTAVERAKMGEIWIQYRQPIEQSGFCEKHGMKKLLYLKKALSMHKAADVFQKLKSHSYRDFRDYSQNARAFYDRDQMEIFCFTHQKTKTVEKRGVFEQDGKLYVDLKTEGRELLCFNQEYLNNPDTALMYQRFKSKVIDAAGKFFQDFEVKQRGK